MANQKDDEAKKLFASRLKAKLAERHMNQNTLADLLGMSESSIGKWTLGKSMPRTMGQIENIASIFGVEKSYFLESAPPSSPPPAQPYRPKLTKRDERDIEKRLQAIRDDLDSESGIALLGDHPLTEDEKEQLLIPIKSGLETARLIAKKKYTPKKYRNGAAQRQNDTATRIGKKVLNASPAAQAAVSDIIRGDEKDK